MYGPISMSLNYLLPNSGVFPIYIFYKYAHGAFFINMTIIGILLNIVGFFALLEGCLGVTSPQTAKSLLRYLLDNLSVKAIRALAFVSGVVFGIISIGVATGIPRDSSILDYILILVSSVLGIFYIVLAISLPADFKESEIVRQLLDVSNAQFRLYETGALIFGIFCVFISIRY